MPHGLLVRKQLQQPIPSIFLIMSHWKQEAHGWKLIRQERSLSIPVANPHYTIKKVFNQFFNIEVGNIFVHIPMVGGAFGGKGTVQLEPLAYLASKAVGGKLVKLEFDREEDMTTAPCRIGLDATIQLGVTKEGKLIAGQYTLSYRFRCLYRSSGGNNESGGAGLYRSL